MFGDLVVTAFFSAATDAKRATKRAEFAGAVGAGDAGRYRTLVEQQRYAERPLVPFHWEIEFPEAFEREPAGFDAIVGNPPFFAGSWITAILGQDYRALLLFPWVK